MQGHLDTEGAQEGGGRQAWVASFMGVSGAGVIRHFRKRKEKRTEFHSKRYKERKQKKHKGQKSQQCPRMTLTAMECIKLCANAPIDCVAHSERLENPTPDGSVTTQLHPSIQIFHSGLLYSAASTHQNYIFRHGTARIVHVVASCLFIKHQPRRYMYLRGRSDCLTIALIGRCRGPFQEVFTRRPSPT